ncbi:heat shock protein DnaJ domain protein [Synechocystis sp. LKSZ1]
MTQERTSARTYGRELSTQTRLLNSHYAILGLHPSASPLEIRRAYRDLSKRFHPDTTQLAPDLATAKFQRLNEAYGILSHPEKRALYDLKIGYSRYNVIQAPVDPRQTDAQDSKSAYLDATDRPLSAGEIFALALLSLTLLGCLGLAFLMAWLRGEPLLS